MLDPTPPGTIPSTSTQTAGIETATIQASVPRSARPPHLVAA